MTSKVIIRELEKSKNSEEFSVGQDEQLTLVLIAARDLEYQVTVLLAGKGAQADIFGLVLGNGANNIRLNTLQQHQAPQTRSNLLVKSALTDRSLFQFEGNIRVKKEAQQTDAYQRNENLLLSTEAKAESKPALEILANDVRCTHSATVGKVDLEQLFYLESRGIPPAEATKIIVAGFFQQMIAQIPRMELRQKIYSQLDSLMYV